MIKVFAYYDLASGEINQISTNTDPFPIDGMGVAEFAGTLHEITQRTHIVDNGVIRERTLAEIVEYDRPTEIDVRVARFSELRATDAFMIVDYPIPAGTTKDAWAAYRQGLRDLGQYASPAEWIANWPARPDGLDPIADLRERQNA